MLDEAPSSLPGGMKLVVMADCGVFENATQLAGFEGLCFLLADDPETARALFDAVGSRILRY